MRVYDITRTLIHGMPTYPGEPGPELAPLKRLRDGDAANVSQLTLGVHTGTHVDAPVHFIEGAAGAESIPLDALCGPARVVAIAHPRAVTVAELEHAGLDGVTRVLFRTRNGELAADASFRQDFVYIAPDAAVWLVAHGMRLVGIDYLSVEAFGAPQPLTHRTLLAAGIAVVEGLDLREPPPGDYELWCLPLKLTGSDGSPARVVLVSQRF